jgi:serine/threonine protein kinase
MTASDGITLKVVIWSFRPVYIQVQRNWSGEQALREILTQTVLESHGPLNAYFSEGRKKTPLLPTRSIDAQGIFSRTILRLDGKFRLSGSLSDVPLISLSNYTKVDMLRQDFWFSVFLYRNTETGEEIAISSGESRPLAVSLRAAQRDVEVMHLCRHHCVLPFLGVIDINNEDSPLGFATPVMRNGSVRERLRRGDLTLTQRFIIAYGTALGMAFLHARQVLHQDLTPVHVLLDENLDPKVAGFHLSKIVPGGVLHDGTDYGGTLFYQAPELLLGESSYGLPVDVFSFGIFLFVLLTGQEPFPSASAYVHTTRITVGHKRPAIPPELPEPLRILMAACWAPDPEARPTFADVVARLERPESQVGIDRDALVAFQGRVRAGSKATA